MLTCERHLQIAFVENTDLILSESSNQGQLIERKRLHRTNVIRLSTN